jgi:hypothetical protein
MLRKTAHTVMAISAEEVELSSLRLPEALLSDEFVSMILLILKLSVKFLSSALSDEFVSSALSDEFVSSPLSVFSSALSDKFILALSDE